MTNNKEYISIEEDDVKEYGGALYLLVIKEKDKKKEIKKGIGIKQKGTYID